MNSGTTLYEEAVALRAEVREVVAILENWNSIEPGCEGS